MTNESAHAILVTGGFRSALAAQEAVSRLQARTPAALRQLRLLNPAALAGDGMISTPDLCTLLIGFEGTIDDVTRGQRAAWQAIELAHAGPRVQAPAPAAAESRSSVVSPSAIDDPDDNAAPGTNAAAIDGADAAAAANAATRSARPPRRELSYSADAADLAGLFDAAGGLTALLADVAIDADVLAGTLTLRWSPDPREVEALAWLAGQARDFGARIVVWPAL